MKVLLINGSSKMKGCTYTALSEMTKTFAMEGVETEILQLGSAPISDCTGCGRCKKLKGSCTFDDDIVNELIRKAAKADAFVFGSPVYYAHASGRILCALDRAFYAATTYFSHKPGAAIVSARRGGTTAALDDLNKYFTIAQMPVVSSTYWNMVHGNTPEEVRQDQEGLETLRNLAKNMVWMMRCIEAGKTAGVSIPETEKTQRTNFIR